MIVIVPICVLDKPIMSGTIVEFRSEVHNNRIMGIEKAHDVGDYFDMHYNLLFNTNVNLNLLSNDSIKDYMQYVRSRLDGKYGEEKMNKLEQLFDQEVRKWMMSVNERVANGADFMELIKNERSRVGRYISREIARLIE